MAVARRGVTATATSSTVLVLVLVPLCGVSSLRKALRTRSREPLELRRG
jgi:hypothetical protein